MIDIGCRNHLTVLPMETIRISAQWLGSERHTAQLLPSRAISPLRHRAALRILARLLLVPVLITETPGGNQCRAAWLGAWMW